MTIGQIIRPALSAGLSWIAITEILHGNAFLGCNTVAAAIYVLLEPLMRASERPDVTICVERSDSLFSRATVDTAPPSARNPGTAFVAGAAATSRER